MNSQKQNWRFKLNGFIITDKKIDQSIRKMMPIKQSKKSDALMNEWLILRNSTIIFPFASRVRSEARVMSNHCQQPNATEKKETRFTNICSKICIHCFDTDHSQELSWPATLNGVLDLAQALGLPSSGEVIRQARG